MKLKVKVLSTGHVGVWGSGVILQPFLIFSLDEEER